MSPPPPPPPPPSGTSRLAAVDMDFDNNGQTDGTETATYDAAGRVTSVRYVYAGDGVADRFDNVGAGYERGLAFEASGRLQRYVTNEGGGTTTFTFVYGNDGLPIRADVESRQGANVFTGEFRYTFVNGRMTEVVTVLGGVVLGTDTYVYDATGRRIRQDSSDGGPPITVVTWGWNADGTLSERVEGNVRYTLSYANGRQTAAVKTTGGRTDFRAEFVYDGQGRLSETRLDRLGDGSVDAVWRARWEAGACVTVRLPQFDPLSDSRIGWAGSSDGTDSNCGP